MKNTEKVLRFAALITAIVFSAVLLFTGCNDDAPADTVGDGVEIPPEQKTAAERWSKFVDPSSTATLEYFSIDSDGTVTLTVGGTAEPPNGKNGVYNAWKVRALYAYTTDKNTRYTYQFEAKTESGTRSLPVQYFEDNDNLIYLNETFTITDTWQTYTFVGQPVLKSGVHTLDFQCADQLGTLYIKAPSITENNWSKYADPSSTATLEHFSVDGDGMVTITVGGIAEPEEEGNWRSWVIKAQLAYTSKANTSYTYQFQAKTASGTRTLKVDYYVDNDNSIYLDKTFTITDTWQTYIIVGQPIPKSGIRSLDFRCANQLGTLYIKAPSITVNTGVDRTITVTGITGKTGDVGLYVYDDDFYTVAYKWGNISNNSVSFNLIEENGDLWLGSGSYYLRLHFNNDFGIEPYKYYIYTNGQPLTDDGLGQKYNISSATSTIAFNKFTEVVEN